MKRHWFVFLAAALGLVTGYAAAQAYPDKVVRIVVPLTPGGGADTLARLVAESLAHQLN